MKIDEEGGVQRGETKERRRNSAFSLLPLSLIHAFFFLQVQKQTNIPVNSNTPSVPSEFVQSASSGPENPPPDLHSTITSLDPIQSPSQPPTETSIPVSALQNNLCEKYEFDASNLIYETVCEKWLRGGGGQVSLDSGNSTGTVLYLGPWYKLDLVQSAILYELVK